MEIKKRDFVKTADFNKEEFEQILEVASKLKNDKSHLSTALLNKTIALIFAKPSLRTRVSFEVGITQLGGNPLAIRMDEISMGSREDVEDIAKVLSRYIDAIVIRTFEQKEIEKLAKHSSIPIINALSNDEHPCQAYADIFTIKEHFKDKKDLKLSYVGDGNNVTHSLIIAAALYGIDISIASPEGYYPNDEIVHIGQKINPNINIEVTTSPNKACENAHIIYTDVWTSMGQEKEKEIRKEVFKPYQINSDLVNIANKEVIVMHCLPAHKGEEITQDVFNKFSSLIYTQAENRLHIQKSILLKVMNKI